MNGTPFSVHF